MPEEFFVLFMLLVLSTFGLTMVSMILRHRRKQKAAVGAARGSSMTTSELESMMRRAVEDATAPLAAKIESLEMELVTYGSERKHVGAHDAFMRAPLEEGQEVQEVEPIAARSKTRG
jgi:hypothetical protein